MVVGIDTFILKHGDLVRHVKEGRFVLGQNLTPDLRLNVINQRVSRRGRDVTLTSAFTGVSRVGVRSKVLLLLLPLRRRRVTTGTVFIGDIIGPASQANF